MFILNSDSPVSLYKQLYNQMREHILTGKLPADSRLPSVRELSTELSVSRNTVEGAYLELYAEGYIFSRPRSGYFVSVLDQDPVPRPQPDSKGNHPFLPVPTPEYTYDFHPASLDPESFPTELWRKCYLESLRNSTQPFSQYADVQGDWRLRSAIRDYLERSRAVHCDPDQVLICSGLQESLAIVAHLLKNDHSSAAVENPGYHLPRSVFRNLSYSINPIPVGPGGIDLDLLKASNSTVVYVTPSHQLPLGYVMPVANRLGLIEWADSGSRYIVEDDYDSELRYHGKPIPSLQGLRPAGNIFYAGTFSKIISPALRMSYLVLPRTLLPPYRRLYREHFPSVSLLEQRTMALFMEQGHWERHIRRMRVLYKKKHDNLLRAVEHYFGSHAVVVGQGAGLHVVLQLPGGTLAEAELIELARLQGIGLYPSSEFYASNHPDTPMVLLGFGRMTAAAIEQGVARLSRICLGPHSQPGRCENNP